jgi:hypothetical protein
VLRTLPDARVQVWGPGERVESIISGHDIARWLRRGEELGLTDERHRT